MQLTLYADSRHTKLKAIELQLQYAPKYCPFSRSYSSYDAALLESTALYNDWEKNDANPLVVPRDNMLFQRDEVIAIVTDALLGQNHLTVAGTGTGKTYMILAAWDILIKNGYVNYCSKENGTPVIPFPVLFITVSAAVPQLQDAVKLYKHCKGKVFTINYEQLRSKQSFASVLVNLQELDSTRQMSDIEYAQTVQYYSQIKQYFNSKRELVKEDILVPEWISDLSPIGIILDEIQKVKNGGALQTKIVQCYLGTISLKKKCFVCGTSATPFVKPSEAKSCTLMLRPPLDGHDIKSSLVTPYTWGHFIKETVCAPSNVVPEEYSPAAMERLTNIFYIKRNISVVTNVKFKHKTINKHILINFHNNADKLEYQRAYTEFLEKLAKVDKKAPSAMGEIFATITAFRKKATWLKRYSLAQLAKQQAEEGYNTIIAIPYKETFDAVIRILQEELEYNKPIARICGGQSRGERWDNVNLFQDEKAHISINMIQAGGVALSMHHYKPRNKRPRWVIMGLVWSIIEQLQMLGRAHRINSDSTTHQWLLSLIDTIEQDVMARLKEKAISARELMRKKEDWSDLFINEANKQIMVLNKGVGKPSNGDLLPEPNGDDDLTSTDEDGADDSYWKTNEKVVAESLE